MIATLLILYFAWIAFCCLEGLFQGYYYSLIPTDQGHPNIHWLYNVMRGIVLFTIAYTFARETTLGLGIVFLVVGFFSAPFFHNGVMYCKRNDLNPEIYKKRWMANKEISAKTEDDAEIEITWKFRLIMFMVSVIFLLGIIFYEIPNI